VYAEQIGDEPTFVEWMGWGIPVVITLVPLMALWLTRSLKLTEPITLPSPGDWRVEEVRVMAVFAMTAVLWVTRTAPFGGWREWLQLTGANDASVALLAAIALATISDSKGGRLLDWQTARKIPWGVLILFGGGICIASAFVESGLADLLAARLTSLASVPVWLLLLGVCLSVTFLTEITSNTATASLLMPLLAATAIGAGIDPKLLMVPAAMSASCAFMLPVATAPNAIIYGSGRVTVARMAREGFVLNLIGVVVISGLSYLFFV